MDSRTSILSNKQFTFKFTRLVSKESNVIRISCKAKESESRSYWYWRYWLDRGRTAFQENKDKCMFIMFLFAEIILIHLKIDSSEFPKSLFRCMQAYLLHSPSELKNTLHSFPYLKNTIS